MGSIGSWFKANVLHSSPPVQTQQRPQTAPPQQNYAQTSATPPYSPPPAMSSNRMGADRSRVLRNAMPMRERRHSMPVTVADQWKAQQLHTHVQALHADQKLNAELAAAQQQYGGATKDVTKDPALQQRLVSSLPGQDQKVAEALLQGRLEDVKMDPASVRSSLARLAQHCDTTLASLNDVPKKSDTERRAQFESNRTLEPLFRKMGQQARKELAKPPSQAKFAPPILPSTFTLFPEAGRPPGYDAPPRMKRRHSMPSMRQFTSFMAPWAGTPSSPAAGYGASATHPQSAQGFHQFNYSHVAPTATPPGEKPPPGYTRFEPEQPPPVYTRYPQEAPPQYTQPPQTNASPYNHAFQGNQGQYQHAPYAQTYNQSFAGHYPHQGFASHPAAQWTSFSQPVYA